MLNIAQITILHENAAYLQQWSRLCVVRVLAMALWTKP